MAKFDALPLFQCIGRLVSVEKLVAGSDKNGGKEDKYALSFTPLKSLVNARGVIDVDVAGSLGIQIKVKLSPEQFVKVHPLLKDKTGSDYHLEIAPDSYGIGDKTGIWYRYYSIDPA